MPDNNIFDILVRFGVDKSKLPEAAAALKKLNEETEKVKKTTAETSGVTGQYAWATKQLEQNVVSATKTTNEFEVSKRQLKDTVKGLKHEFPLLATGLKLFTNPLATSIGLLAAATGGFIEMRRHAKALAADVKFDDVAESARNLAAAQQDVIDKSDDYFAKLRAGASLLSQIKGLSDDQTAAIDAQAKATEALAEAEDKLARAMLDYKKTSGQITEQEAADQEAALDKESGTGKAARDQRQRAALLQAARDERDRLVSGRDALETSLGQQRYARMGDEIAYERRVGERANITSELEALKAKEKSTGLRPDEYRRKLSLQSLSAKIDARLPDLQGRIARDNASISATESDIVTSTQQIAASDRKITGMERGNQAAAEAAAGLNEVNQHTANLVAEIKKLKVNMREAASEMSDARDEAASARRRTQ